MPYIELILAVVFLTVGSIVFFGLTDKEGKPKRWTTLPGAQMVVLIVVLGGWLFGASFLVDGLIKILGS